MAEKSIFNLLGDHNIGEVVDITSIRIKQIIAETLKVSLESISDDLALGDIPEWDSLAHVRIIGELEINLGVYKSKR